MLAQGCLGFDIGCETLLKGGLAVVTAFVARCVALKVIRAKRRLHQREVKTQHAVFIRIGDVFERVFSSTFLTMTAQ